MFLIGNRNTYVSILLLYIGRYIRVVIIFRIMELSQDVGHKPIIFIRFNPDEYTDENGDCVTSCWGVNKLGLCVVKKSK